MLRRTLITTQLFSTILESARTTCNTVPPTPQRISRATTPFAGAGAVVDGSVCAASSCVDEDGVAMCYRGIGSDTACASSRSMLPAPAHAFEALGGATAPSSSQSCCCFSSQSAAHASVDGMCAPTPHTTMIASADAAATSASRSSLSTHRLVSPFAERIHNLFAGRRPPHYHPSSVPRSYIHAHHHRHHGMHPLRHYFSNPGHGHGCGIVSTKGRNHQLPTFNSLNVLRRSRRNTSQTHPDTVPTCTYMFPQQHSSRSANEAPLSDVVGFSSSASAMMSTFTSSWSSSTSASASHQQYQRRAVHTTGAGVTTTTEAPQPPQNTDTNTTAQAFDDSTVFHAGSRYYTPRKANPTNTFRIGPEKFVIVPKNTSTAGNSSTNSVDQVGDDDDDVVSRHAAAVAAYHAAKAMGQVLTGTPRMDMNHSRNKILLSGLSKPERRAIRRVKGSPTIGAIERTVAFPKKADSVQSPPTTAAAAIPSVAGDGNSEMVANGLPDDDDLVASSSEATDAHSHADRMRRFVDAHAAATWTFKQRYYMRRRSGKGQVNRDAPNRRSGSFGK